MVVFNVQVLQLMEYPLRISFWMAQVLVLPLKQKDLVSIIFVDLLEPFSVTTVS